MVTPRRSARVKALDSSPVYSDPPSGTKRKSDATGTSPKGKRGRKSSKKEGEMTQQTIEEAMDVDKDDEDEPDAEDDDQNASDEKAENPTTDNKPEVHPVEDVEMSEDPKVDGSNAVAEPDKSEPAQEPKPEVEAVKAPEQTSKEDGSEPTKPATDEERQQTTIDTFTTKQDETEPIKPKEPTEAQASGALQPDSSVEATGATSEREEKSDKKDDQSEQPHQEQSIPQLEQPEQPEAQPSVADYQQTNGHQSQDGPPEQPTQYKPEEPAPQATNGDVVEAKARDHSVPSSILEKGIVYFFFRARVNINEPQDVNDIARSYMILRPLPKGAKLGDGPIGDDANCRLIAIPKKVLPLSGKDRFLAFVESSKQTFNDLKTSFLSSSDYATKTQGTSHSPAATPIAEGVYAITTTGKDSHFAYMTTLPSAMGEVQKDVGIKEQGSFSVSAKNPKHPGPANATLQKQAEYPQNIIDEFRDLRWFPGGLKPELLDYENTQFLLIGESGGIDSALEPLPRDEKKGLDDPKQEMERLEGEDELRVKHLKGDDAVFADLGISKKDYPGLLTTWES